jgi:hypothetical protein
VERRPSRDAPLHNACITTRGHSETLNRTQEFVSVLVRALTSSPLLPYKAAVVGSFDMWTRLDNIKRLVIEWRESTGTTRTLAITGTWRGR